jgi:phenylacetate-CoA ligase
VVRSRRRIAHCTTNLDGGASRLTMPISTTPPPFDYWHWMQAASETWAANADPTGYAKTLRARRLDQLLQNALAGSPLYRRRAGSVRRPKPLLADFEPIGKRELMRNFDDWACDRSITRESVERFVADPTRLADAYLGHYLVWTSSGTSGEPAIFVQDTRSLAAYDAIDAVRFRAAGVATSAATWSVGHRFAFIGATGGHFAGHASIRRLQRFVPAMATWFAPLASVIKVYSVLDPLRQLARELQAFQPTVLITYPSCAAALAQQQVQGELQLRLAETWVGGEQLSAERRVLIRESFGCVVRNNYGASEFYAMASECAFGHLHLNDDWVILEPVDDRLQPVPVGEQSFSTLLTNLANHTQPLVRYELGDRIRYLRERCECGSRFPTIEVEGRADDTLSLDDAHGHAVTVLPLALTTAIEEGAHVAQFQLLRTAPDTLEMRFESSVPDPAEAYRSASAVLEAFLARHGLPNVRIERGASAPLQQPRSGKLQRVSCLPAQHDIEPSTP